MFFVAFFIMSVVNTMFFMPREMHGIVSSTTYSCDIITCTFSVNFIDGSGGWWVTKEPPTIPTKSVCSIKTIGSFTLKELNCTGG